MGWKLPRDTIPRWFEYYNNTFHFNNTSDNINSCASVSQDFSFLADSEGIWVACQDPELPPECHAIPESCHPVLNYDTGMINGGLRTIKMRFALYGFSILRLQIWPWDECFDYSFRNTVLPGPKSCELRNITSEMVKDGWIHSQFYIDPLLNYTFSRFSLEMIAISPHEVVLLDKIEATSYLLCGPDAFCTTTTLPPTTRQTSGPIFPSSTPDYTNFPSSLETPTQPSKIRSLQLRTSAEALPNLGWTIPCTTSFPRWLDYYHDVNQFLSPTPDQNLCADEFLEESVSTDLGFPEGIWVACKDPELPQAECVISSRAPCHPFIQFGQQGLDANEAVVGIELTFFLYGQGRIKLTLSGGKCIEFSKYQDENSFCEFVEILDNPKNTWARRYFEPEENVWLRDFQIDMIAKNDHDFVLVDKVVLTIFEVCDYNPDGCPQFASTTTPSAEETTLEFRAETERSLSTNEPTDAPNSGIILRSLYEIFIVNWMRFFKNN
ncbi:hypothetical protein Ocin01_17365 [Orchesella cincta]|uniref:Uncharacterized protein n=1 Tax=Orchesella cincta TaxID=48709 RepID=A0A1D2M8L4_ORCCI|nr:hypothetical protein Ocin01_17365 [Orchesella cincta]